MRSLRGALAGVRNDSPVPLAVPRTTRGGVFNLPGRARASMPAQMETYASVGTVFAVVQKLYTSVSRLDWHLYRKSKSGLDEDRTEITKHAVLDLWNRPNPFMSRQQLVAHFQQHKDLTGEGNLVIGRARGFNRPIELWPIRPDRLEPVPDPYKFLKGWIYSGPGGEKVPLELNEILRSIYPSPLDPYRGLGPIQSIITDLDGNRSAKEWQAAFFENGARPGGIIEIDRRLDDDAFDEMRDRWAEQHQGASKAHRVAIIEQGGKWVEVSNTMRDLQLVELSGIGRDTVLEVFGFPKFMLGMVDDVNRANAEASEYMFSKWLVEPRAEDIKGMLNTQLLPLYGRGAELEYEFDYDSPVPENAELEMSALTARSGATAALVPLGFDPAEVLEAVGLPEMEFEKPAPPPAPVLPAPAGAPEQDPSEAETDPKQSDHELAARLAVILGIDMAQKWESVAHLDDSTCDPCRDNGGKTYKNRADAYADYPGGRGYKDCVGAQYGNTCRCSVQKRKASS